MWHELKDVVDYARRRHPEFAQTYHEAMVILMEEVGEAAKEAYEQSPGWKERFECEIQDVAAVCIRILEGDVGLRDEKPLEKTQDGEAFYGRFEKFK